MYKIKQIVNHIFLVMYTIKEQPEVAAARATEIAIQITTAVATATKKATVAAIEIATATA